MSNKTEHFPTDMREDLTEIVNPNKQLGNRHERRHQLQHTNR